MATQGTHQQVYNNLEDLNVGKKKVLDLPKNGSFTLSDYLHSIGVDTSNVYILGGAANHPDIIVREVKRI